PGRLRIQTIDSFNYWLASQLPLAAKAGGALAVAERPQELYYRAARRLLIAGEADEGLAADIELLFDRVDNRWDNVERLVAEMLAKRGHWLRYVIDHPDKVLTERVDASLRAIVCAHLEGVVGHFPASLRSVAGAVPSVGALGSDAEHLPRW